MSDRRTLLGVTPPPHADEQLRCEECGLVTAWFHGWSFTCGRSGTPCDGPSGHAVTGRHHWTLERKPNG